MVDAVSVALVGIGGYGEVYLSELLAGPNATRCKVVGAVDPEPQRSTYLSQLERQGVPLFDDLTAFYAKYSAELAVIAGDRTFALVFADLEEPAGKHEHVRVPLVGD